MERVASPRVVIEAAAAGEREKKEWYAWWIKIGAAATEVAPRSGTGFGGG